MRATAERACRRSRRATTGASPGTRRWSSSRGRPVRTSRARATRPRSRRRAGRPCPASARCCGAWREGAVREPVRTLAFSPGTARAAEPTLAREWLVTNGLGGFGSGTVAAVPTRRYHGLLVAALPAPLGRTIMLNHLSEWARLPDGVRVEIGGQE